MCGGRVEWRNHPWLISMRLYVNLNSKNQITMSFRAFQSSAHLSVKKHYANSSPTYKEYTWKFASNLVSVLSVMRLISARGRSREFCELRAEFHISIILQQSIGKMQVEDARTSALASLNLIRRLEGDLERSRSSFDVELNALSDRNVQLNLQLRDQVSKSSGKKLNFLKWPLQMLIRDTVWQSHHRSSIWRET